MRNDFNKVLTERPRSGHKRKHKHIRKSYTSEFNVRNVDEEDGPLGGTEGMRKPYRRRYIEKNNTDLWSAIKRFMRSRVGRKWDDVWSEVNRDLCESDDMRAHWRVHCKIEVDEKVSIAPNGRLWRLGGRGSWSLDRLDWSKLSPTAIPGCNKRFYVDPRDGILYETPDNSRRWWRATEEAKEDREERISRDQGWEMSDGTHIQYIGEIWYSITTVVREYTVMEDVYGPWDQSYRRREVIGTRPVTRKDFIRTKKQLNSRELKKYGVANGIS